MNHARLWQWASMLCLLTNLFRLPALLIEGDYYRAGDVAIVCMFFAMLFFEYRDRERRRVAAVALFVAESERFDWLSKTPVSAAVSPAPDPHRRAG